MSKPRISGVLDDIDIKPIEPNPAAAAPAAPAVPPPAAPQIEAIPQPAARPTLFGDGERFVRQAPMVADPRGALYAKVALSTLERLELAAISTRRKRQDIVDEALQDWFSARGL